MQLLEYYKELAIEYAEKVVLVKDTSTVIHITELLQSYLKLSAELAATKQNYLDDWQVKDLQDDFKKSCDSLNQSQKSKK